MVSSALRIIRLLPTSRCGMDLPEDVRTNRISITLTNTLKTYQHNHSPQFFTKWSDQQHIDETILGDAPRTSLGDDVFSVLGALCMPSHIDRTDKQYPIYWSHTLTSQNYTSCAISLKSHLDLEPEQHEAKWLLATIPSDGLSHWQPTNLARIPTKENPDEELGPNFDIVMSSHRRRGPRLARAPLIITSSQGRSEPASPTPRSKCPLNFPPAVSLNDKIDGGSACCRAKSLHIAAQ
ncbi:hypothetical protein VTL71DRAFT_1361 [Oculimacula yallundae]|uniref:Uncharacterized protein n=1 Tax=Oculimacula yallundae TaxID=86028 RepID=A0ABR4CAG4_9HELO